MKSGSAHFSPVIQHLNFTKGKTMKLLHATVKYVCMNIISKLLNVKCKNTSVVQRTHFEYQYRHIRVKPLRQTLFPQLIGSSPHTVFIHALTRCDSRPGTTLRADRESSVCPPFLFHFFALLGFRLAVYTVAARLAVLMEMPAVWLLTPHKVHLLK